MLRFLKQFFVTAWSPYATVIELKRRLRYEETRNAELKAAHDFVADCYHDAAKEEMLALDRVEVLEHSNKALRARLAECGVPESSLGRVFG